MRHTFAALVFLLAVVLPGPADASGYVVPCKDPKRLPDGPVSRADVIDVYGVPASTTEAQAVRHLYERDGCSFAAKVENGTITEFSAQPERPCINAFPARHQPPTWRGRPFAELVTLFGQPDRSEENIVISRLYYSRPGCEALVALEDGAAASATFGPGLLGCGCPVASE